MARTRIAGVAMMMASACANVHVNRATLIASTAALACDWAQTRSSASTGWMRTADGGEWVLRENNPILGPHPSTQAVDVYFASAAVVNLALWIILPVRYKSIMPLSLVAVESSAISGNVVFTTNDQTRNSGICGL